jgi:hypothetical protein
MIMVLSLPNFVRTIDVINDELYSQLLNLAVEGYAGILSSSGLPKRLRAGKASEMMAKICQAINISIAETSVS